MRTLLILVLFQLRTALGLALVILLSGIGASAEPARRHADPRVFGDMEWRQIIRTSETDPDRGVRLFFFASRPNDSIAFAVGTTHQNERITQVAMLQNALGRGPAAVKTVINF